MPLVLDVPTKAQTLHDLYSILGVSKTTSKRTRLLELWRPRRKLIAAVINAPSFVRGIKRNAQIVATRFAPTP